MAMLQHLVRAVLSLGVCGLFERFSMPIHEDQGNLSDEFASAALLS